MVKGVNKTVIEVNNTGSRYFEKIVFYVTPQYGNLTAKQLQKATGMFCFNFDDTKIRKPIRKIKKRQKLIKLFIFGGSILSVLITAGILIF